MNRGRLKLIALAARWGVAPYYANKWLKVLAARGLNSGSGLAAPMDSPVEFLAACVSLEWARLVCLVATLPEARDAYTTGNARLTDVRSLGWKKQNRMPLMSLSAFSKHTGVPFVMVEPWFQAVSSAAKNRPRGIPLTALQWEKVPLPRMLIAGGVLSRERLVDSVLADDEVSAKLLLHLVCC